MAGGGRRKGGDVYPPSGVGDGYVAYTLGDRILWLPPGVPGQRLVTNGALAPSWESGSGAGGSSATFTASDDFEVPDDIIGIWVDITGAGGGGGGGRGAAAGTIR